MIIECIFLKYVQIGLHRKFQVICYSTYGSNVLMGFFVYRTQPVSEKNDKILYQCFSVKAESLSVQVL